MKKESGGIAILVLFVFLILSLLLLYMLSSLELRVKLSNNMYDGAQSSYISESLAQIVLMEKLNSNQIPLLYEKKSLEFENISFGEGVSEKISIRRNLGDEENYSSFILEVAARYREIESKAQIVGDLVDPVFFQMDGILERSEMNQLVFFDDFLMALEGKIGEGNKNINGDQLYIRQEEKYRTRVKSSTLFLEKYLEDDNLIEETSVQEKKSLDINLLRNNFLTINGSLQFTDETEYRGIIRINKGGRLELNSKLSISGLLILEEGARIDGPIYVEGLVIDLGAENKNLPAKLDCETVEKLLYKLDGFLVCDPKKIKKTSL